MCVKRVQGVVRSGWEGQGGGVDGRGKVVRVGRAAFGGKRVCGEYRRCKNEEGGCGSGRGG